MSEVLILLPMVTPEIIMGISLLIFFGQLFGAERLARADRDRPHHVLHLVRGRRRPGPGAEHGPASRGGRARPGASASGAFWHVTLPLIAPAVAAGAMLAFALSFDDLVITSFNAGVGSTTLPIFIYRAIEFGVTPQINAISTIIVAVVAIALFIGWRLGSFGGDEVRAVTAEPDAAV